jgi:hypothetical protein
MAPFVLHPSYILRQGLIFCGLDEVRQAKLCKETQVRIFKSHYGRHPLHLARVYRDLQVSGVMTEDEGKSKHTFYEFLLANNFLRCYEEDDLRYVRFGKSFDELTRATWAMVDKLAGLKEWKIKCPSVWPAKLGVRRNPKNYSYKHNIAGLNYQIVLSIWTQEVFYANSGDPAASTHDMTAIRKEFVDMVPDGCRVVADSAYAGKSEKEKRIFSVENNLDCDEVKKFKARVKSRHESFNSRCKVYKCLKMKGRHGLENHKKCFAAVVVLVQYAIEDTSVVGESEPLLVV